MKKDGTFSNSGGQTQILTNNSSTAEASKYSLISKKQNRR